MTLHPFLIPLLFSLALNGPSPSPWSRDQDLEPLPDGIRAVTSKAVDQDQCLVLWRPTTRDAKGPTGEKRLADHFKGQAVRGFTMGDKRVTLLRLAPDASVPVDLQPAGLEVLAVSHNAAYRPHFREGDPLLPQQWYLDHDATDPRIDLDAASAWQRQRGSREVIVAVIDTGIDLNHPDLAANIYTNPGEIPANGVDDDQNGYIDDVHGFNFVEFNGNTADDHGHGTYVAGVLGAVGDNGIGISGVAPLVSLMPIRFGFDSFSAAEAVTYAVQNGAKIINLSWGGSEPDPILEAAVQAAAEAGVLVTASAGGFPGQAHIRPTYPADWDTTLAVGVVSNKPPFNNLGSFGDHVDLTAPGQDILSTVRLRTVIYAEDFEDVATGAVPAGSSRRGDDGVWAVGPSPDPANTTQVLRADALAQFPYRAGVGGTWTSEVIPLDQIDSPVLSMDVYDDKGACSRLDVEVFDGQTWRDWLDFNLFIFPEPFATVALRVPDAFISDQFQVRLTWDGGPNQLNKGGVALDNFQVYTESPTEGMATVQHGVRNSTSVATAMVSGVAALLFAQFPQISAEAAAARLMFTGTLAPESRTLSNRIVNAEAALTAVGGLTLHTGELGELVYNGAQMRPAWTHFDPTDATVSLTVEQNGTHVQTLFEGRPANGRFTWRPNLPVGRGYRLRLTSAHQSVASHEFEIAQAPRVAFADDNLEALLTAHYDSNGDGYVDVIEAEAVTDLVTIANTPITSLVGLEHFTQVIDIFAPFNEISALPDFSGFQHLIRVNLDHNRLTTPPVGLPETLQELDLSHNRLTAAPVMPANLGRLNLGNNQLTELPPIPDSLRELRCPNNALTWVPDLNQLDLVILNGNQLTSLPQLNQNLNALLCRNNQLTALPELPCGLDGLLVGNNQLTALPDLPLDLTFLEVENNQLTDLANLWELPHLDHVRASGNRLTHVDPFEYASLQYATFYGNPLEDVSFMLDLEDWVLPGVGGSLLNSDDLDGLIWNPDADQRRLDCDGSSEDNGLTDLTVVRDQPGTALLSWRRSASCGRGVDHFRVYRNQVFLGQTTGTDMHLAVGASNDPMTFTVEAVTADGGVQAAADVTLTTANPQHYTYLIPRAGGDPNEWTGLALTRDGAEAASVTVAAVHEDTVDSYDVPALAHTRTLLIPGRDQTQPATVDWYRLASTRPLNGVALFGNGPRGFSGGALDDATPRLRGYLPAADFNGSQMALDLINPNDTPVQIQFEVFQKSGVSLHVETLTLAPMARRHGHLSDLLNLRPAADFGMIRWNADQPVALSSVFYAMGEREFLAVTPSLDGGALTGLLPRVTAPTVLLSQVVDHYLLIHNPNAIRTTAVLRAYDERGRFVDEVALQLNPGESRWFDNGFLFFNTWAEDLHLTFTAENPIHVVGYHQAVQDGFTRWKMESILPNPHWGSSFTVPHVARPEMWETELYLTNPEVGDQTLTLTAKGADGAVLEARSLILGGNAHVRLDPSVFFERGDVAMVGVDVDNGQIAVNLLYTPIFGAGEGMADIALKPTRP